MKKVSFIKGQAYYFVDIPDMEDADFIKHFDPMPLRCRYKCTESFTAEITVKIVPYEQV